MIKHAIRVGISGALVGVVGFTTPTAAQSKPAPPETHCVVEVVDIDLDGVLTTGPETCFLNERSAVEFAQGTSTNRSSGTTIIGTHYKNKNYAGSSITIVGTTCGGGVWWPTGSWNNNIESSRHYCGSSPTRFYDSSNCSTGVLSIYSARSTLGWMNNRASCVRYG